MDKGASSSEDRAFVNGAASVSAVPASVPSALWPVYEFRPIEHHMRGTVLRYADGDWIPDDGEWDVAFITYGMGAPLGLGVHLPQQRNIVWSGLTSHWSAHNPAHPRGNAWHYMLRGGETQWGGQWLRDHHPNERAARAAMSKCCAINGCANGSGPEFQDGNPYIVAGLVRERDTKAVVRRPAHRQCMYCDEWESLAQAIEARRAATTGVVHESAVLQDAPNPDSTPKGDKG